MSVIKDWEVYYTMEEMDKMLDDSIKRWADELINELRQKKKERDEIKNNEISYV